MKILATLFTLAFATNLCAVPIVEDSDPYPYQDLSPKSLKGTEEVLTLTIKVHTKNGQSQVEAQVILCNNTNQKVQMIESSVFLDFQLEIRNQTNEILLPNSRMKEIIAARDSFIHSDEVLEPSQGRRYFFNVSKVYDLMSGKTYRLTVSRTVKGTSGILKLTSNSTRFTVP